MLNYDGESPNLAQEKSCSTWKTLQSEDMAKLFKLCYPCVMRHIFLLRLCIAASVVLLGVLSGKLLAHLIGMSLNMQRGRLGSVSVTVLRLPSLLHCQLIVMSRHIT